MRLLCHVEEKVVTTKSQQTGNKTYKQIKTKPRDQRSPPKWPWCLSMSRADQQLQQDESVESLWLILIMLSVFPHNLFNRSTVVTFTSQTLNYKLLKLKVTCKQIFIIPMIGFNSTAYDNNMMSFWSQRHVYFFFPKFKNSIRK